MIGPDLRPGELHLAAGQKMGQRGTRLEAQEISWAPRLFIKSPAPGPSGEAKQRRGMQHVGGAAASQVESAYEIVESDPGRTGVGGLEIGTAGREGAQVRLRGHWVTKEFKGLP